MLWLQYISSYDVKGPKVFHEGVRSYFFQKSALRNQECSYSWNTQGCTDTHLGGLNWPAIETNTISGPCSASSVNAESREPIVNRRGPRGSESKHFPIRNRSRSKAMLYNVIMQPAITVHTVCFTLPVSTRSRKFWKLFLSNRQLMLKSQ